MTNIHSAWHVLGAGSIGCLFACNLQRNHRPVQLIVREAARAMLQERNGITLERNGELMQIPLQAEIAATLTAPIQNLLLCTKAHQALEALKSIRTRLQDKPTIVLLQNGMGLREKILQAFPSAVVLHAVTTEGAYQRERFHVIHAGRGETFVGAIDDIDSLRAQFVADALHGELRVSAVDDIEERLWRKLAVNSVINPLSALANRRNGELLEAPGISEKVRELCDEVALVAAADGHQISPAALLAATFEVMRATASNRSSMLQDIQAGRPTEIEYINGFIVRKAMQYGIPCPQQITLYDAIKNKEHAFS